MVVYSCLMNVIGDPEKFLVDFMLMVITFNSSASLCNILCHSPPSGEPAIHFHAEPNQFIALRDLLALRSFNLPSIWKIWCFIRYLSSFSASFSSAFKWKKISLHLSKSIKWTNLKCPFIIIYLFLPWCWGLVNAEIEIHEGVCNEIKNAENNCKKLGPSFC